MTSRESSFRAVYGRRRCVTGSRLIANRGDRREHCLGRRYKSLGHFVDSTCYLRTKLAELPHEVFVTLLLDSQHRLVHRWPAR